MIGASPAGLSTDFASSLLLIYGLPQISCVTL
jgi:hypothetical protein